MDDTTNPEAPEVVDDVLDTEAPETAEVEVEYDDDGNPVEPEPEESDDTTEIEVDGQKFRVPAALKDKFLMQADYTRKTQEVAEMRRSVEAQLQQVQQVSQAEQQAQAEYIGIQQAIAAYSDIDWQTWIDQDPVAAQKARFELDDLRSRAGHAAQTYQQAQNHRLAMTQQETARRLAEGQRVLATQIPDWNAEKARSLSDFGMKTYGFSADDLNSIDDPRMIVALHDAFQFRQTQQRNTAAKKVQVQQSIKPAAKVTGKPAIVRPLDDRASTDAWMKARNAQVAKR